MLSGEKQGCYIHIPRCLSDRLCQGKTRRHQRLARAPRPMATAVMASSSRRPQFQPQVDASRWVVIYPAYLNVNYSFAQVRMAGGRQWRRAERMESLLPRGERGSREGST